MASKQEGSNLQTKKEGLEFKNNLNKTGHGGTKL